MNRSGRYLYFLLSNLAEGSVASGRVAAVLLLSLLFLTSCAETQLAVHGIKEVVRLSEPESVQKPKAIPSKKVVTDKIRLGTYKVGKPYEINGLWYYPKEDPYYNEVGIASWYGEKFHGKVTANGAIYDMNDLTAAHKTLPMPSKVRVTNLTNGRSLNLDINDRGPFVNGRIIDLSRRAAQLLGFQEDGLAMVRVQSISEDGGLYIAERLDTPDEEQALVGPNPTVKVAVNELPIPDGASMQPLKEGNGGPIEDKNSQSWQKVEGNPLKEDEFFVQVGAFLLEDNASQLSGKLTYFGAPVHLSEIFLEGQSFYRVRVGPVYNVDSADTLIQQLIKAGYTDSHLVAGKN